MCFCLLNTIPSSKIVSNVSIFKKVGINTEKTFSPHFFQNSDVFDNFWTWNRVRRTKFYRNWLPYWNKNRANLFFNTKFLFSKKVGIRNKKNLLLIFDICIVVNVVLSFEYNCRINVRIRKKVEGNSSKNHFFYLYPHFFLKILTFSTILETEIMFIEQQFYKIYYYTQNNHAWLCF